MGGSIATVMLSDFIEEEFLSSVVNGKQQYTIILCHSHRLGYFKSQSWSVDNSNAVNTMQFRIMTELSPLSLKARANLFLYASKVIVLLDYNALVSTVFLESLSFVKLLRKPIHAAKLDPYFYPTGACAAICMAYGRWYNSLESLITALQIDVKYDPSDAMNVDTAEEQADVFKTYHKVQSQTDISLPVNTHNVFFSFCEPEGHIIADYLQSNVLVNSKGNTPIFTSTSQSTGNLEQDVALIQASSMVIFIITGQTNESVLQYDHVELIRRLKKPILPIKRETASLGESWLALILAGKLYYEIDPTNFTKLDTIFKNIPNSMIKLADSCPRIEIKKAAQLLFHTALKKNLDDEKFYQDRNEYIVNKYKKGAIEMGVSTAEADQTCLEIDNLPKLSLLIDANQTASAMDHQTSEGFPPAKEVLPPKQEIEMSNIHYTVTRFETSTIPDLYDEYGFLLKPHDVMISYEWNSQEHALDYYFQLHMKNLTVWFDVMGSMQGNMNTAMANSVETMAAMVVLLSHRYENSINCRLELEYAITLKKPVIFVLLPGYEISAMVDWIRGIIGESYQVYPLREGSAEKSSKYLILDGRESFNEGVPLPGVIATAVRKYAAWKNAFPPIPCRDCTPTVFLQTRALLQRQVQSANAADNDLLKVCTRCGVKFNPNVPSDGKCRRHRAYFMGGTLIAPRWVCCEEHTKDGVGCEPTSHICDERVWTLDEDYGTYTYIPA
jgi:hypothetical protein